MFVHRYWTGSKPPAFHDFITRSVHTAMVPGDKLIDWADETLPADVRELVESQAGKVRERDTFRHRANVARLALLRLYGGVWLDHDLVPLERLGDLPSPSTAAVAPNLRCVCFMAFPAGHPLLSEALEAVETTPLSDTARSVDVSGDRLITAMAGPDVAKLLLPLDRFGNKPRRARPWALHLWNTG